MTIKFIWDKNDSTNKSGSFYLFQTFTYFLFCSEWKISWRIIALFLSVYNYVLEVILQRHLRLTEMEVK